MVRNIMLKKFDHVSIIVNNMAEAIDFFALLGFSIEDKSELKGKWISSIVGLDNTEAVYVKLSLPGSTTNIELMEYHSPPPQQNPEIGKANRIGLRHIAFEVENIDEVTEKLKSRGVEFLSPVQTHPESGKKLVYFLGPDGILLELAQYS